MTKLHGSVAPKTPRKVELSDIVVGKSHLEDAYALIQRLISDYYDAEAEMPPSVIGTTHALRWEHNHEARIRERLRETSGSVGAASGTVVKFLECVNPAFAESLDAFIDERQSDYADFLWITVDAVDTEPGWHRLRCTIKSADGVIDATNRAVYASSGLHSQLAHTLDTARAIANREDAV